MDWKAFFIPIAANALLTFLHHVLYVRPAQLKIKQLSAAQDAAWEAAAGAADAAVLRQVDSAVVHEANKLGG